MILRNIPLGTASLKTTVVAVPQWGEDAEVMLTELTIKGKIRQQRFITEIQNRKADDDEKTALFMCANIMCAMVDPETGDFLVEESQLDQFRQSVEGDTISALLVAYHQVNPIVLTGETLDSKKKKS